ncbi:hypothetical protein NE237_018021 [Protea cynaroides]|uniref:Uncharacterized protein n=1 Tax=Protea cynaroides TaxID=273540 RepID=A0A9Q0K959_9MAGN|nr:hypothetical protein NE237_018021 [Protea cynaroides]
MAGLPRHNKTIWAVELSARTSKMLQNSSGVTGNSMNLGTVINVTKTSFAGYMGITTPKNTEVKPFRNRLHLDVLFPDLNSSLHCGMRLMGKDVLGLVCALITEKIPDTKGSTRHAVHLLSLVLWLSTLSDDVPLQGYQHK